MFWYSRNPKIIMSQDSVHKTLPKKTKYNQAQVKIGMQVVGYVCNSP